MERDPPHALQTSRNLQVCDGASFGPPGRARVACLWLPSGAPRQQCCVGSEGRWPGLFEGSPAILTFPYWPPPPPPSPVLRLIIN